jgi:hypothetical protein
VEERRSPGGEGAGAGGGEVNADAPTTWPSLVRVTLVLCGDCLAGVGGECHTPGCALWMNRAPDVPIADKCESFVLLDEEPKP